MARFRVVLLLWHVIDLEAVDGARELAVEVRRDQLAGPDIADGAGRERLCGSARLAGRLHVHVQIIQVVHELRLLDCCLGLLVREPLLRVEVQEPLAVWRLMQHAIFFVLQSQDGLNFIGCRLSQI